MTVSREAVDGLLDHAAAKARALDRLEMVAWFAFETLIEVEEASRKWGPLPMPQPELELLMTSVRHAISLNPANTPETPGDGVSSGEAAAPSLGPATDIAVDDDISHVFDDLKTTDDGEAA